MRLSNQEVARIESSIKSIEDGMLNLANKKKRLLEQLGRVETLPTNTEELVEIEEEGTKYKILGKCYKCQPYKKDGSLSEIIRYVEIK